MKELHTQLPAFSELSRLITFVAMKKTLAGMTSAQPDRMRW